MVVAGRVTKDDVAIMMVEAEATTHTIDLIKGGAPTPTEEVVAQGLDAAKPFIKILCDAQSKLAKVAAKPTADFPVFLDYQDDVFAAVEKAANIRPFAVSCNCADVRPAVGPMLANAASTCPMASALSCAAFTLVTAIAARGAVKANDSFAPTSVILAPNFSKSLPRFARCLCAAVKPSVNSALSSPSVTRNAPIKDLPAIANPTPKGPRSNAPQPV
jgi:hypothetical protein